jgi:hypothetical protein
VAKNKFSQEELDAIHQKLLSVSEKYRQFKKRNSQKVFLAKRLDEEIAREKILRKKLAKEKRDFDKMGRLSLKHLFHLILQNDVAQKEKERQEWLAAQLQWEQCRDEIESLEKEYATENNALQDLGDITDEYENLFHQKEEAIAATGSSAILHQTSEKITKKNNQLNEILEAREVALQLLNQLEQSGRYLKSASGWGTWDMLGGGLIATAIKRSKMDAARAGLQNAQHLLNQFNKELADVSVAGLRFETGGFAAFADYFFDCLIIDWMVQSSINKAYQAVYDLWDKVKIIDNDLLQQEQICKQDLASGQEEYGRIVESSSL